LKILKERGYINLTGFDPSKKCVEDVRNNGIYCVQGSIFEAKILLSRQKFDCIILSHVMEHIYDLNKTFEICSELLEEKGILYIEVPDAAYYVDYYVAPYYYFDSEHINHFDEVSLSNMGTVNGFSKKHAGHKTIQMSEEQLYPALYVVFDKDKINETILPFSTQAKESIEKYVELSIQNSQTEVIVSLAKTQEEIYVFGAGNFTLRLLASTDLSKCNIKAFIDNDSNKQGRFLENRPIVVPEVLKDFNGTILICSALFAQDIVDQVKVLNPRIQSLIIR
jgi:predicted SAM-dependent methyltransferase